MLQGAWNSRDVTAPWLCCVKEVPNILEMAAVWAELSGAGCAGVVDEASLP